MEWFVITEKLIKRHDKMYRTPRGRCMFDSAHLLARLRVVHGQHGRPDLAIDDLDEDVLLKRFHPEPTTLSRGSVLV